MTFRLLAALILLACTACAAPLSTTPPSVGATASATGSEPASPSPTEEAVSASPSPPAFPPDTMVRAGLPGITLRTAPGLSGERLGTLLDGSRSFVVRGPVEADGYAWILLSGPGLPPASGCATPPGPELTCPAWFGWAATGDPETGKAWFVEDPTTNCPDPSRDPRAFMMLGDVEALHCYGSDDIELVGWIPGPGAIREPEECLPALNSPSAWLWWDCDYALSVRANDWEEVYVEVFVDPDSDLELAYPGHWARVVGHLDDADAAGCADLRPPGDSDPDALVLGCRTQFVVTSLSGTAP